MDLGFEFGVADGVQREVGVTHPVVADPLPQRALFDLLFEFARVEERNLKITTPDDVALAEALAAIVDGEAQR